MALTGLHDVSVVVFDSNDNVVPLMNDAEHKEGWWMEGEAFWMVG
jgi:hypothetical protein